jgi:hypothetical protein
MSTGLGTYPSINLNANTADGSEVISSKKCFAYMSVLLVRLLHLCNARDAVVLTVHMLTIHAYFYVRLSCGKILPNRHGLLILVSHSRRTYVSRKEPKSRNKAN